MIDDTPRSLNPMNDATARSCGYSFTFSVGLDAGYVFVGLLFSRRRIGPRLETGQRRATCSLQQVTSPAPVAPVKLADLIGPKPTVPTHESLQQEFE